MRSTIGPSDVPAALPWGRRLLLAGLPSSLQERSRWRSGSHSCWVGAHPHIFSKGSSSPPSLPWCLEGSASAPLFFMFSAAAPTLPSAPFLGAPGPDTHGFGCVVGVCEINTNLCP